jgi:hypothetical protein
MFDPNDETYKLAKQRVKELKDFYMHLAFTLVVVICLYAVSQLTGDTDWFYYPSLFFVAILALHAASTFLNASDWEERKIRQLMERRGAKPKKELPAQEEFFERTSDV